MTWLVWGTIASTQINAYSLSLSFAVVLTLGTSIFTLIALAPSAKKKRKIDLARVKRAATIFFDTLSSDHRYIALAVIDVAKIILSLMLLANAKYLTL